MTRRRLALLRGLRPIAHGTEPPGGSACERVFVKSRGEQALPPRHVWRSHSAMLRATFTALLLSIATAGPLLASPPGSAISNQASLEYLNRSGQLTTVLSNEVTVTTAVPRSAATVDFIRVIDNGAGTYRETVGPAACLTAGSFELLDDPVVLGGNRIDPAAAQDVSVSRSYNSGETTFIRLQDSDQNRNYQAIETVVVTLSNDASGDVETLQLSETGPDTGVFTGYITLGPGAPLPGDCVLQGISQSTISVSYTDSDDATDSAESSAQLDPVQRVFESRTGTVVTGSTIEIVDAATGLPAVVYGNDGVSRFPSAIPSGGTVTDSAGTSYVFAPGEYRFPVVPDGDYRLVVTPPAAYTAPSSATITELQNLPGAPFDLSPASFGNTFSKRGDVTIAVDIPLDPLSSALFLQKKTLTTIAAPGDFVRYELLLENPSQTATVDDITIVDRLPAGTRFVPGSVTIDGSEAPDAVLGADARTLEFSVASLAASGQTQVFYVVEIIAGGRDTELVNSATAFAAGGLLSNDAVAVIRLSEDLFRSTATIIGRIVEADCSQDTFSEDQGVADIRVYLEDGRYAVSDDGGRFHFEGLTPGTHVAQLDRDTVPDYMDVIGCGDTPGYAGSADSQFVRLSRGSLKRADFYLRRKAPPQGRIDIEMSNKGTDSTEQVEYAVTLNGIGNVEVDNIELSVTLPDGVRYQAGTLQLNAESVSEPGLADSTLSMGLASQLGNWRSTFSFIANIDDQVDGELVTRAHALFDTPMRAQQQTPVVETRMLREPAIIENAGYVLDLKFAVLSDELSPPDKAQLEKLINDWRGVRDIRLSAIGHSDSQRISPANRHLFADNYALSRARANAAALYIAEALQIGAASIQVEGRGPDDPVADNATAAGRQKNRRVELVMSGIRPKQPSFLELTQENSGTRETSTVGAIPGLEVAAPVEEIDEGASGMPSSQKEPPLESLSPGTAMLLPAQGFAPAIPATKVSIQHAPGQSVDLKLNGVAVNSLNFDGVARNAAGTVAVSRWIGVQLVDGTNELSAFVLDADGSTAQVFRRVIHYTGGPIRAELVEEKSTLFADGKSKPVIALRLFDRAGKPARAGIVGRFRVNEPYRSAWDEQEDRKNALVEIGDRSASYRVDADGIALLELAPTTQTGEVTVVLPFQNYREQEVRAWLRPAQRDWILVGFAEGTAGYNTLSKNAAAAMEAGEQDGYFDDGRVAFFAKGSVKGEYLLTLAFDSARDYARNRQRFDTIVDPNAYYSLYADVSEQRYEAASQRKLYLKLERSQFYALFGDFDTGLSVTELARYERRFNGLKSEYRGANVAYTAFAAETDQSFNRDEIRGDGTSGLYRLSKAPIIANSEQVRIEVRDRFDSGMVLSTRNMARFLDYTLDTMSGTLYFKSPVASRDLDLNPVYIVVEYESLAPGTEDLVAGGRGALRLSDDSLELGVTHINDDTAGAETDLTGVDFRWQIDSRTQLKGEIVSSNATMAGVQQSGSAHSVELEHNSETVDLRAYIREVEAGFGLGYQSDAEQGVRRLGIDVRSRLGRRFVLEGEAAWQQNLQTTSIRQAARAQLRYERDAFTARFGAVHAEDEFSDGHKDSSDLIELGATQSILDGQIKLHLNGSTSLGGEAGNLDYPTQVVVGADYRVADGVDLVAEYEDAKGRNLDAKTTRIGVRATPWSQAQINSFLSNETNEFGPRLFANVGLIQGFRISERWLVDVGVDNVRTLSNPAIESFDSDRELTSGSRAEDFMAAYTGAMYSSEFWSANARVEWRNADSEDRVSVLMGWYRQPAMGHSLSAGLTVFQADSIIGNRLNQANLRLGWAYRPADREWSFLNRTDLEYNLVETRTDRQNSWRLINNLNANRRISAASELSLQYAFKFVNSQFGQDSYKGYTDLIGIDYRRGFGDRWDSGVNTSIYNSHASGTMDYGFGLDVGYNVGRNLWLTLGYNFAGFDDKDFEQARYTSAGPYLRFSMKADQGLLKAIAGQR